MRWFLFLVSLLIFVDGAMTFTASETIFQQIIGGIMLLISAVLFSAAAIVDAIVGECYYLKDELKKLRYIGAEIRKHQEKGGDEK